MIKFNFTSPGGQIFAGDAMQVSVPTTSGVVAILERHTPLIATIRTGELVITKANNTTQSFAVYNGVLQVKDTDEGGTEVNVLVSSADDVEDLDIKTLQEAMVHAKDVEKNGESFEDVGMNGSAIERELNKVRLAKKHARTGYISDHK